MHWDIVTKNLWYLLWGTKSTLQIAGGVLIMGTILGFFLGLLRLSNNPLIGYPTRGVMEVTRGTPLIMQMFFIFFGLPALGLELPKYPAAVLAMTLFAGGNAAEIVRGAIQSLPKGQTEAAKSLGMNYSQTMTFVILPQAVRRMIPPMMGLFTTLIKDTSLAAIIGVFELTRATQETIERTFASFELYLTAAFIYFVICYPLSLLTQQAEKSLHAA
ncbi:MAG: amino acid ABC transporter permease [candidate division NC10 bacterium]|nr:amino acid ABC transporter permease [candidate division NC10 bacterium]